MTENSVVRERINGEVKDEASHILKAMGLTVSDSFRMMKVRIVQEKKLPFSPLEPNDETIVVQVLKRHFVFFKVSIIASFISSN